MKQQDYGIMPSEIEDEEYFVIPVPEDGEEDDEDTEIVYPIVSPDVAATYW